jgi:hypothetical protein
MSKEKAEEAAAVSEESVKEEAAEVKEARKPRTTIAIPLQHSPGEKQSEGEVARYFEGRNKNRASRNCSRVVTSFQSASPSVSLLRMR